MMRERYFFYLIPTVKFFFLVVRIRMVKTNQLFLSLLTKVYVYFIWENHRTLDLE